MTVQQLIEALQKHDRNAEVCVEVTKCVSPAVAEPVTEVHRGFDWTTGKVMLFTADRLIRELETCRRCGMYGVKAAARITSRVSYVNMDTGDMEIAVYLDGKKKLSIPFNVRREMREKEDR